MLFCFSFNVLAQSGANIFIWDHDQGASFRSRTTNQNEGCETALARVLKESGYDVTVARRLPRDLEPYDAVFITLGFFCPA